MTATGIYTTRQIGCDEAQAALNRVLNTMFNRRDGERARIDYDDDLILGAFIEQQRERNEIVAWIYESAHARNDEGVYSAWRTEISTHKPGCVPEGSIRNMRPLYVGEPV